MNDQTIVNAESTEEIVDYVRQHHECTRGQLKRALPHIDDIDTVVDTLTEGAKEGEGFILIEKSGKLSIGPLGHLIK